MTNDALEPRIEALRVEYGLVREDFWQIKQNKQWVCKHAALEVVAVRAKIEWLPPIIIEHNAEALVTSMIVTGQMGDRTEWATGETNPTNYSVTGKQPAYPWAMSEKRAKDRVILKLVGIHGVLYSDAEMDAEGASGASAAIASGIERISSQRAKVILNFEAMLKEIDTADTAKVLDNWQEFYGVTCEPWMPGGWVPRLLDRIAERRTELANPATLAADPNTALDKLYNETMRDDGLPLKTRIAMQP